MGEANSKPSIDADPRSITFGFGPAETLVRWDAQTHDSAVVRVSCDDGEERVFASGARGQAHATWIQPGSSYSFRLYGSADELLASVEVVRPGPADAGSYVTTLRDPAVYAAAVQYEHEYWGRLLNDPGRKQRSEAAWRASNELEVNRDLLGLQRELASRGVSPVRTLSLGCGEGRLERELLQAGLTGTVDAIDIAREAVEAAQRQADAAGLSASYRAADLNFIELPRSAYDLVIAQTSLHHLLELEHVLDQVKQSMRPNALFWVDDFIGESQFQWLDTRIDISRRLIDSLPETLRQDDLNQRRLEPPERRPPGALASPFESLRSAEIPILLRERFAIVAARESGTVLTFVAPLGTYQEYARTPGNRRRFERLFALDRLLAETGALPPLHGQYLLRA